jgi:hypothetical protein
VSKKNVTERPHPKVASRTEVALSKLGAAELGPPVLLEGEDEGLYERLLAR